MSESSQVVSRVEKQTDVNFCYQMRQICKLYSFSYTQLKHTVIISVLYLALGIMMQVRLEITEFRTNLFMSNAYMQTDSEGNLLQNI